MQDVRNLVRKFLLAAKKLMFQRRQKSVGCSLPQEQIDLTSTPKKGSKSTKNAPKRAWIENDLYSLSQTDREILLSPTAWLNDNIICAAQMILKEQSVLQNGFQPSTRGQTYTFEMILFRSSITAVDIG